MIDYWRQIFVKVPFESRGRNVAEGCIIVRLPGQAGGIMGKFKLKKWFIFNEVNLELVRNHVVAGSKAGNEHVFMQILAMKTAKNWIQGKAFFVIHMIVVSHYKFLNFKIF